MRAEQEESKISSRFYGFGKERDDDVILCEKEEEQGSIADKVGVYETSKGDVQEAVVFIIFVTTQGELTVWYKKVLPH